LYKAIIRKLLECYTVSCLCYCLLPLSFVCWLKIEEEMNKTVYNGNNPRLWNVINFNAMKDIFASNCAVLRSGWFFEGCTAAINWPFVEGCT